MKLKPFERKFSVIFIFKKKIHLIKFPPYSRDNDVIHAPLAVTLFECRTRAGFEDCGGQVDRTGLSSLCSDGTLF